MNVSKLLPPRPTSLAEFNRRCSELSDAETDEGLVRLVHYAVTGQDQERRVSAQISVLKNAVSAETARTEFRLRGDWDSLLGYSDDLPFQRSANVHVLARPEDTLTKDVHVKWPQGNLDGPVAFHKISNIALMSFARAHITRLMLPKMRQSRLATPDSLRVPDAIQDELFALVREAATSVDGGQAGHWPASRHAELVRIRQTTGKLSYGTQSIAGKDVLTFGDELLRRVRAKDWGGDAFYFHQIRGTRGESSHDMSQRKDALYDYLESFADGAPIAPTQWWIDGGIEIQHAGHVLLWRRDAHWALLADCLHLGNAEAEAAAKPSSKMELDECCQLRDAPGFRFVPSARDRGQTEVYYVQAYHTEKSPTYLLEKWKVAKQLDVSKVIRDREAAEDYAKAVGEGVFHDAEDLHDGNARFETRVRLDKALSERFSDEPEVWAELVVSFPRKDWWRFKQMRLKAFTQSIGWWHDSLSGDLRGTEMAVGLVVALVWMINALNNRPLSGGTVDPMMRALLPHELVRSREEVDGEIVEQERREPRRSLGLFFIAKIMCDVQRVSTPRLHVGLRVPEDAVVFLTKGLTYDAIRRIVAGPVAASRPKAHVARVPNKMPETRLLQGLEPAEVLTTMEELGHTMQALAVHDEGSDLDEEDVTPARAVRSLDEEASICWKQFASDILAKSPNMRGSQNGSYLSLSPVERSLECLEVFKRGDLRPIFRRVAVTVASHEEWTAAFDLCWPFREPKTTSAFTQNWHQVQWRKSWSELKGRLDASGQREVRRQFRVLFDDFRWFPNVLKDRIWITTRHARYIEYGGTWPAPRVLLNPRHKDDFQFSEV